MPAATRVGDADVTHCSGMVRAQGSPDVFVNGRPWSRVGDPNTGHMVPCPVGCCGHSAPISAGSGTVFVNKIPAGRIGDPTCTAVAAGSPDVFAN